MKKVLEILNEISEVSGKNDKKVIIKNNLDNELFIKVVKYALDQNRRFNLTELPQLETTNSADIFDFLDYLSSKRGATDRDAMTLASRCGSEEARDVVTRIINKDLRIGANAKTFNSVMKNWVYKVPYQRYKSFAAVHQVDFENEYVVAQLKLDGMFSYLIPSQLDSFISRNGNRFNLISGLMGEALSGWMSETEQTVGEPLVWLGELLVEVDGKYLPRKTGNGIINKFISGDGDIDYEDKIIYVTWGFITKQEYDNRESLVAYEIVLDIMEEARESHKLGHHIRMSPTIPVGSLQEALAFYKKVRARDEEGAMVKVASKLTWKDQASGTKYGVKLKAEVDCEMEIVDAYPGATGKKYEHMLGGITVKSACGKILTDVGGGFSDQERSLGVDFWKQQIGKIITVRFTDLITDKSDRKTMCLSHSRFVETRFNEKEEADTLEYIREELKNA